MAVDPDVDLHVPEQRAVDAALLAVIALGGVLGAEGRYAVARLLDSPAGGWPWDTWLVNVTGSFLIGVLMAVLAGMRRPSRLLRPFLGVGVLGGFTTFSTAMVEVPGLLAAGRPGLALLYLAGTALTALLATALGVRLVRAVHA
jgi:fluoride exporter